ncbi:MAG: helix-turn-helix transcriptional regulator [Planctomycetes bacterium]|nr:helix-turn-helix transcriptional regulator [Planctomycetota bacterium]
MANRPKNLGHYMAGPQYLEVDRNDRMQLVPPHDHTYWEVALVLKGRAEHFTKRKRVLISTGDVLVIRPGTWHTYLNVHGLGLHRLKIGRRLLRAVMATIQDAPVAPGLFFRGEGSIKGPRDGTTIIRMDVSRRLHAERLMNEMDTALAERTASGSITARGYLLLLIGLLARVLQERAAPADLSAPQARRVEAATDAVDLLEARYAERLRMREVARSVGMRPEYMRRVFLHTTGQTPLQYLATVRVQRACLQLADLSRPIREIAAAVGFPDANLFARRFKALVGQSPSAFRRKHLQRAPKP